MSKYPIKLTELDRKILYELDKDGRISYSQIAKNIETTPQVVKYHYERLMDYEAIKHFWAFLDYDLSGYSFFWGYWMKFSGLSKDEEKEMFEEFVNHKNIAVVMKCDGYADVMLGVVTKDVFHHNKIIKEIYNKYGKYITMNDIVVGLGFVKFPRSYLINQENTEKKVFLSIGSTSEIELTKLDRQIMSLLQMDGRMEFTKMADILNVSISLVHQHYKKLIKDKVIARTTYTFGYNVVGLNLYRVLFKLMQFNQERMDEFFDYCTVHPNINNYINTMGNWDLMLDVEIKDRSELRDLLQDIKHKFKDIIFRFEINEVYSLDKFNQMVIEYPDILKKKEV